MNKLAGIDYGSKMAGTTVFALWDPSEKALILEISEKKKDADRFLQNQVAKHQPDLIVLDAPLSLPGRLIHGAPYESYFYRLCDQHFKAMSPMFLGGLTARAIQLKDQILAQQTTQIVEGYPSAVADLLDLKALNYKKEKTHIPTVLKTLNTHFPFSLPGDVPSWHHVDALLCLLTALRIQLKQAEKIGDPKEGLIYL
ncbi:MAG: hypothetical protein AAF598_20850 [Bacteroidota bacterium]